MNANVLFDDPLTRAFLREEEAAAAVTLENYAVLNHSFRCVLCGRTRCEEMRSYPGSDVCEKCVEEAGIN